MKHLMLLCGLALFFIANSCMPTGGNPVLAAPPRTYATVCQTTGKDCRKALLQVINADRASRRLAPYTLDLTQSVGTPSCVGTMGHSVAMRASGFIWHTNPAYPLASFPKDVCGAVFASKAVRQLPSGHPRANRKVFIAPAVVIGHKARCKHPCFFISTAGENVGEAFGNKWLTMLQVHQEMMSEGPTGGHFQNLMSSSFTRIGIDARCTGNSCFLSEDFTG